MFSSGPENIQNTERSMNRQNADTQRVRSPKRSKNRRKESPNGIQKVWSSILLCSTKDNKLIIKHLQPSKPFELGGFFRKRHRFLRPLEAK